VEFLCKKCVDLTGPEKKVKHSRPEQIDFELKWAESDYARDLRKRLDRLKEQELPRKRIPSKSPASGRGSEGTGEIPDPLQPVEF
jgi:hypothetical protein